MGLDPFLFYFFSPFFPDLSLMGGENSEELPGTETARRRG